MISMPLLELASLFKRAWTISLLLKKIFEGKDVEISRLSYGIPMGTEIDYLDEITLARALSDRKKIS